MINPSILTPEQEIQKKQLEAYNQIHFFFKSKYKLNLTNEGIDEIVKEAISFKLAYTVTLKPCTESY